MGRRRWQDYSQHWYSQEEWTWNKQSGWVWRKKRHNVGPKRHPAKGMGSPSAGSCTSSFISSTRAAADALVMEKPDYDRVTREFIASIPMIRSKNNFEIATILAVAAAGVDQYYD